MKVSVIVAAAGRGQRFGGRGNKVLERLKGRPIFLHSLELFSARDDVGEILLVVNADDRAEIAEKYGPNIAFMNARLVTGGATRSESIRQGLDVVSADCDYVAVHDAARPALSQLWIDEVFSRARETGAAILATPVHGTLKRVERQTLESTAPQVLIDGEPLAGFGGGRKTRTAWSIVETVDREGLWQAQTPQVFLKTLLVEAYAKAPSAGATDDAALVEALGHAVAIVPGDPRNVKITTPGDLKLVEAVLGTLPKPKPKTDANPFGEAQW